MDSHQSLIEHIGYLKELTDTQKEDLRKYFAPKSLKAGDFLTKYGVVSNCVAFVHSGYCRVYVIDYEGNEVTIHMAGHGDFLGAISSFITRKPSEEYVQAVTDAELLCITYKDIEELYGLSATWEHVGRRIMEHLFMTKQKRVMSFIKHSAEKRYQYLLDHEPDMLLNVPMQYIASYLGIKPETLSRIRSNIS